jgi:hypothetical protein
MAHELVPRNGIHLAPSEVAKRLSAEFAYVKIDADEGMKEAKSRAQWIERSPEKMFLGKHKEALEIAAMLNGLVPGEALKIEFGDDPKTTLRITVLPKQPIIIGYRSTEHQAQSKDLVQRCAHALDCDAVIV